MLLPKKTNLPDPDKSKLKTACIDKAQLISQAASWKPFSSPGSPESSPARDSLLTLWEQASVHRVHRLFKWWGCFRSTCKPNNQKENRPRGKTCLECFWARFKILPLPKGIVSIYLGHQNDPKEKQGCRIFQGSTAVCNSALGYVLAGQCWARGLTSWSHSFLFCTLEIMRNNVKLYSFLFAEMYTSTNVLKALGELCNFSWVSVSLSFNGQY